MADEIVCVAKSANFFGSKKELTKFLFKVVLVKKASLQLTSVVFNDGQFVSGLSLGSFAVTS